MGNLKKIDILRKNAYRKQFCPALSCYVLMKKKLNYKLQGCIISDGDLKKFFDLF